MLLLEQMPALSAATPLRLLSVFRGQRTDMVERKLRYCTQNDRCTFAHGEEEIGQPLDEVRNRIHSLLQHF